MSDPTTERRRRGTIQPSPHPLDEPEDLRGERPEPNPYLWSIIVMLLGFAVAVTAPAGPLAFVGLVGVATGGVLLASSIFGRLS